MICDWLIPYIHIIQLRSISVNPSILPLSPYQSDAEGRIIMTTVTVNVPVAIAAPRGAELAASLYHTIASSLSIWRRARQARRVVADRVAEAAGVRAYAWQIMSQDRGYAADLLAAADRHELS